MTYCLIVRCKVHCFTNEQYIFIMNYDIYFYNVLEIFRLSVGIHLHSIVVTVLKLGLSLIEAISIYRYIFLNINISIHNLKYKYIGLTFLTKNIVFFSPFKHCFFHQRNVSMTALVEIGFVTTLKAVHNTCTCTYNEYIHTKCDTSSFCF